MKISRVGNGAGKQAIGMLIDKISPLGILAIAIDSCTLIWKCLCSDLSVEDVHYINSTM